MLLKNKKIFLIVDVGPTPSSEFTKDYQSGALSFEIISNGKKLISNCGYYQKAGTELNKISKSSATQNTLVIDDNSSCKFKRFNNIWLIKKGLKIINKSIIYEKDYWKINA